MLEYVQVLVSKRLRACVVAKGDCVRAAGSMLACIVRSVYGHTGCAYKYEMRRGCVLNTALEMAAEALRFGDGMRARKSAWVEVV